MKFKIQHLIIFLMIPFLGVSQKKKTPDYIPKAYSSEYKEAFDRFKELQKEYDVVLPPGEQIAVIPQTYDGTEILNWGNKNLGITDRYEDLKSRAQRKVRVYIFDTAGDLDHKFLSKSAQPGFSYTGESSKADGNGHGTHCAGIYGAWNQSQQLGIARVLVENGLIEIVPVKVLTNSGSGFYSWMTAATNDMIKDSQSAEHKDKFIVFSYSLGGGSKSPAFDDALSAAKKLGIATVAAAGNGYEDGVDYPGSSEYSYAIGATDIDNEKAGFSDIGPELTFAAPGVSIVSTYPGGILRALSGTSMATPTEGAIYALTASIYPKATLDEIHQHLIKHATDLPPSGFDSDFGHGLTVIDRILDNPIEEEPVDEDPVDDPIDEPEDPRDPDDELPTKNERKIAILIPSEYTIKWKRSSEGKFRELKINIERVVLKTKYYAGDATGLLYKATFEHFRNRYYIVPDSFDYLDTGKAVKQFYEMLLKRDFELDVDLRQFLVVDDRGHWGEPGNAPLIRLKKKASKVSKTAVY